MTRTRKTYTHRRCHLKDGLAKLCVNPIGETLWSQKVKGIRIGTVTSFNDENVFVGGCGEGGGTFSFRRRHPSPDSP